ncbi:MAG: hypothetical protein KOO61_01525 [Spirochaetales bacterium]|nr:hypothetical protein [Spirochaetales bacterium]
MRRTLGLALLLLPVLLSAQDVAEDELRDLGTADIEFINYEGPHDRIDTDQEIRAIGRALAAGLAGGRTEFDYVGKYRVIHAVDPSTERGLDADIIIPLATARVDHIDNVRRIVSGFLSESYDYQRDDADILARFVTIYNAVSRGNMDFFDDRYKPVVVQHMSEENAGLSRRYDEWPGKSRIVIPLGADGGPGVLGTVDPGELGGEQVVEELRSQDDMGIEDRQELVDLTERVVEEREEAVDREEVAITEEEQRIAQREEEIQAEREEGADDERERQLAEEEAALQEDRAEVDERREELQDDRQEVAELTTQVREEREQIASDTRALLDESEISDEIRGLTGDLSPIYFIQVREESGTVLGQLVQINPVNGLLVNRSAENAIVSRSYTFVEDSLLVIAAEADTGRLAVFEVTSLEELRRGAEEIFLGSSLAVHGDPAAVYAVVRQDGDWYVGRFGADLALIERSVIAVNPYTTFAFSGGRLWIQTKDDRIVALGLADMRIAP